MSKPSVYETLYVQAHRLDMRLLSFYASLPVGDARLDRVHALFLHSQARVCRRGSAWDAHAAFFESLTAPVSLGGVSALPVVTETLPAGSDFTESAGQGVSFT